MCLRALILQHIVDRKWCNVLYKIRLVYEILQNFGVIPLFILAHNAVKMV